MRVPVGRGRAYVDGNVFHVVEIQLADEKGAGGKGTIAKSEFAGAGS